MEFHRGNKFIRKCRALWHINYLLIKQRDNYSVVKQLTSIYFAGFLTAPLGLNTPRLLRGLVNLPIRRKHVKLRTYISGFCNIIMGSSLVMVLSVTVSKKDYPHYEKKPRKQYTNPGFVYHLWKSAWNIVYADEFSMRGKFYEIWLELKNTDFSRKITTPDWCIIQNTKQNKKPKKKYIHHCVDLSYYYYYYW